MLQPWVHLEICGGQISSLQRFQSNPMIVQNTLLSVIQSTLLQPTSLLIRSFAGFNPYSYALALWLCPIRISSRACPENRHCFYLEWPSLVNSLNCRCPWPVLVITRLLAPTRELAFSLCVWSWETCWSPLESPIWWLPNRTLWILERPHSHITECSRGALPYLRRGYCSSWADLPVPSSRICTSFQRRQCLIFLFSYRFFDSTHRLSGM